MNPQTQAEARRILEVIDELTLDLECVAVLPTTVKAFPERDMEYILRSLGDDPTTHEKNAKYIRDHIQMEARLDRQVTRPGFVVASSSGAIAEDGPLPADQIEHLHLEVRALTDILRSSGYGTGHYQPQTSRSGPVMNFVHVLTVLRGLLKDRFETTVEEDVVKFAILNDTVNRADAASADVSALNRDLHQQKQSRKEEVEKRQVQIQRLEKENEQVDKTSQLETANIERNAAERREADHENAMAQLHQLLEENEQMEHELAELEKKYWQDELVLRQQRTKKEAVLKSIIEAYDTDMTSLTDGLRQLRFQITNDKEEFARVDVQLQKLVVESDVHAQEMALEEERKSQTATIAANRHVYSRVIQAFFRSHMTRVRAAMKNKKKKKRAQSA